MILDPLRSCGHAVWSARVTDFTTGTLDEVDATQVLPTASVGKIFALIAVADLIERGVLDPDDRLEPTSDDMVADSGLLQHLVVQRLAVDDLARLVGAVSDNLATNVLLRRIGLSTVQERTTALGITDSALNDVVRDDRRPGVRDDRRPGVHAATLSHGTAAELSRVAERLDRGGLVSSEVSARVRGWLATNTDLSMVASALAFDPLAHGGTDRATGMSMFNKTGTDEGTRADVGVVRLGDRRVAYAVIARWGREDMHSRAAVLDAMRTVGLGIRAHLTGW